MWFKAPVFINQHQNLEGKVNLLVLQVYNAYLFGTDSVAGVIIER